MSQNSPRTMGKEMFEVIADRQTRGESNTNIPNARSAERNSDLAIIMYRGTLYICACMSLRYIT